MQEQVASVEERGQNPIDFTAADPGEQPASSRPVARFVHPGGSRPLAGYTIKRGVGHGGPGAAVDCESAVVAGASVDVEPDRSPAAASSPAGPMGAVVSSPHPARTATSTNTAAPRTTGSRWGGGRITRSL